jgi:transposase
MLYIGIDIAKRSHTALALQDDRQRAWADFEFANDRDGFESLQARIVAADDRVLVGLEATGIYWLPLFTFLTKHDVEVVVFNPLQIHAYRKSGIRKRKDDRIDAFWIADFMRVGNQQSARQFAPDLMQLRELTRFRTGLTNQIGSVKKQVIGILDRIFPEYETLFSSIFIQTSRQLLTEAVAPADFAEFDLSELVALLRSASRGRFGADKAAQIQAVAARSVGVAYLADALRVQIRCLLAQLELLEEQRAILDDEIEQFMSHIEQHITSIPGIGPVTGAAIIAEIADINRFDSPTKLVAFAGIDPTVYQSGDFQATHTRMSKRGSPYLRHALWQAASSAVRFDPQLKDYYQKRRAEGKHHNVILGAVSRRLLNRIYVILKENRPYEIRN